MTEANDKGNITISDHILIKDVETNEILVNTRGHSNSSITKDNKKEVNDD